MSENLSPAEKRLLRDFESIQQAIDSEQEQLRGENYEPMHDSTYKWVAIIEG